MDEKEEDVVRVNTQRLPLYYCQSGHWLLYYSYIILYVNYYIFSKTKI